MSKRIINPFIITGYLSPEYFCNRQQEVDKLTNAAENKRNVTLLSLRRMGKTGLIKHFFHIYSQNNRDTQFLYLDIMPTSSIHDFNKELSRALIYHEQSRSEQYLNKIRDLIIGIKGKISFNPVTGVPELEIGYKPTEESVSDMDTLFNYVASQKQRYVIAIDEFQQIINYPELNMEALLRKYCQQSNNATFIFSGSNKHLLTSMFSDYGRPFYQSTEIMFLDRLKSEDYTKFIVNHFNNNGRIINEKEVEEWLHIYDHYTFYTQYFFNKLFSTGTKKTDYQQMHATAVEILLEREHIYHNYKNLLTENQFNLLKAIAKEGQIATPTAGWFIQKYHLIQASSVNRAIQSLLDKEMIFQEKNAYRVYDLFFSQWLAQL